MPGLVDMEPPEAPSSNEPTFSVIHQEVELHIDFRTRKVTGHTELTIEPQSKDLKFIKLSSRGITVENIVVESKYPVAPTAVKFRDPYDGFRVRESYGVEQHHIIRENIEDAVREPPEPNLVITLPKQMRVQPVAAFNINVARARGGTAKADGSVETPAPRTAERAEEFEPFTISMDFTLENTRHAIHWAGIQDGDSRYPHLYTTASSVPGSLPSFVFPCVGTSSSRCSWRLTIQCPRTLGDIGRGFRKGVSLTNGIDSRSLTKGPANGVVTKDVDMADRPGDDYYDAIVTDDEKDRELVAVCSGFMEDSDVPLQNQPSFRKWVFHCENPVAAHHIGFAIGPFERVNLTEFRENENEDQLKLQAVNIYGFCLPGRAAELRNIGMPLTMAMDFITQTFESPYPFPSASLSHKMCFVDDLVTDVVDTATLSICSSRHLIPDTIIDKTYESSRILIRALASQWIGVSITAARDPRDYWIIVGCSYFIADMFMERLWGKNRHRYRQHLASKRVAEMDIDRPSLYDLGGAIGVDSSELEFMTLKAPLVLFILHQRFMKKTGHNGIPKVIQRVLKDASGGRLVDGEITTDRLAYSCEKVAHIKMASFFSQWIYGAGCPTFVVTQKFNKKKMHVELSIHQKQTMPVELLVNGGQKLNAGNFMREVKENEGGVYAGAPQAVFTGPVTIRIHEADGTPYEHTAEIDKSINKFEIPYNTKYKRLKRSKLQKEREAAAAGVGLAEDGDGDVLVYCLGDGLQTDEDIKEWRLTDWTKEEEALMSEEFYEWLRFDKDFEWICNIELDSKIHMWVSQLQQDNDVVAQMEAIEWLQARQPRSLISTVLIRTVMDERYFYGVRTAAVNALTRCATPELDYIGQFHLLKAFQSLFCFENSSMTRSNDFSDQRLYHIQCEIPKALSRIRDLRGKAPSEVKRFFLDRLKFNDNSSNEYSDNYYVATLLNCLAESMIEPQVTMSFEFEDLSEEAAEIDFKRAALNEIERHRRIDEWIPSYRNLYTRAALHCQKRLIEAKAAPRRVAGFMHYLRPGNLDEVRLAALDALIQLGMLRESTFLRCALRLFSTEPSPYLRDQFWALIERGFGMIAFDDDPVPSQATLDGFTIAEGESAEARQERADRTESIEGALKSLRRRLSDNKVLQESLMDALRSPIIGIKDFLDLLGTCNMLYTPGRGVVVILKYPRYYQVQHVGSGKLRFFKTAKWRTEKIPPVDFKNLKRRASTHRSVSPEAKRRRTSITLAPRSLPLAVQAPFPLPAQTPQSSLPSPTASQPTSFSTALDNHIASPTISIPQQQGSRSSTPKVPGSSTSRGSTPIAVRAPAPKPARAPTPKTANLKITPPKTAAPKAPAPKAPKPKSKLVIILQFHDRQAEFASKVAGWEEIPQSPDDLPLAQSIARLAAKPAVAPIAPLTARPLPSPVTAMSSSTLGPPPKAPFKVKLKLKMGGGGGGGDGAS